MNRRDVLALLAAPVGAKGSPHVNPPATDGSGMPFLTNGPDGTIYLSWTEPSRGGAHALRLARWTGAGWAAPETIATGTNWFLNWADFGSVTIRSDGSMLAHWLARTEGGGRYGYGVRLAMREPGRPAWRQIHTMGGDQKDDYTGFLTFAAGTGAAVYLSPPTGQNHAKPHGDGDGDGAEHDHRKTARFIEVGSDGTVTHDQEIDPDVCSCCQTAIGRTRDGWIAAYRDHAPGEIRDIAITRFHNGAWTKAEPLHTDGWQINGCPTDGPSLATNQGGVAIVWLTRAGGSARVQVALSSDGGVGFHRPLRIDGNNPLGRPSIQTFDERSYLVVWLEKTAKGGVEIRLRRVTASGELSTPVTVTRVPIGRAAGFPKIAIARNQILVAWRDGGVRAALMTKEEFAAKEKK